MAEQIAEIVDELRALRAAMDARMDSIEQRLTDLEPARPGVTKEDAEAIGALFWIRLDQSKGPRLIVPVQRVKGIRDEHEDGNIAYRVERTDEEIMTGGAIYRTVDSLFFTQAEAEAPGRTASRTTGRKLPR